MLRTELQDDGVGREEVIIHIWSFRINSEDEEALTAVNYHHYSKAVSDKEDEKNQEIIYKNFRPTGTDSYRFLLTHFGSAFVFDDWRTMYSFSQQKVFQKTKPVSYASAQHGLF